MALLLGKIFDGYNFLFNELPDERVKNWFLMSSLWPVLVLVAFYLYFVKTLGPRLMKDRPPFNLEKVMIVYNAAQIVACGYIVYVACRYGFKILNFRCDPVDYSTTDMAIFTARQVWFYFIIKVVDLLDTVFFVLRKKDNQVTFLHLYHHAGMVLTCWFGVKYVAGGHSIFIGLINSFVHVIMYTYYLLTSMDNSYKNNVWWKKHITQLQLIQFLMLIIHFGQLLVRADCGYPKWLAFYLIPQNVFMMCLFFDFYRKTYMKPKMTENHASPSLAETTKNGKQKYS